MSTATSAALRGTLEDFGAEEILRFLASTKQSGALVLSGDSTGTVWFADGAIYGADATTSLPLRDAVIAAGLVDEEQWDAAWSDASDRRSAVRLRSRSHASARRGRARAARRGAHRRRGVRAARDDRRATSSSAAPSSIRSSGVASIRSTTSSTASRARLERWREVATVLPSIAAVVALAAEPRPRRPRPRAHADGVARRRPPRRPAIHRRRHSLCSVRARSTCARRCTAWSSLGAAAVVNTSTDA